MLADKTGAVFDLDEKYKSEFEDLIDKIENNDDEYSGVTVEYVKELPEIIDDNDVGQVT